MWLALVLLPLAVGTWVGVTLIDDHLSDRIESNLTNVRRVEAARIVDALGGYERDATSLAAGAHVTTFTAGVRAVRANTVPDDLVIGGYDSFAVVDPSAGRPLDELVSRLENKARTTGSEVTELRIVGLDGAIYGETAAFSWTPYDPSIVRRAIDTRAPVFGNAFIGSDGGHRLGLATPILASGVPVGVLLLETKLGPIVDLVREHEGAGETIEAHIAQPTPSGDAEFITLLRFERDAAFTKVVPAEKRLPINQALQSPGGQIVRSPDYRQVDSVLAIETLEPTGWGLVVKLDAAEAFAPVQEIKRLAALAAVIAALVIVVGWLVFIRPLGRRLRRTAAAAARVAAGDYKGLIADPTGDEIGDMARSIDRLATDLDADIAIRSVAEDKLRRQASHDDLTGLYNRKHAADEMHSILGAGRPSAPASVLFLDLDGFKTVNDTYGHAVGDEALVAVASRLRGGVAENSVVARWGGDEFVVILPRCSASDAATVADRVRALLEEPVVTSAGLQRLTCSIGTATAIGDRSIDELLFEADAAMFAQKQEHSTARSAASATKQAVSLALEEGRMEVWYQPIVTLDGVGAEPRVIGCEALVRLRAEDGAIAGPATFLPDLEGSRLALDVDRFVASTAMADVARWRAGALGDEPFLLALNLGASSMREDGLAVELVARARRFGLAPESLLIELPEGMHDFDEQVMREFRMSGASLAIDDFGTQHSNLDRLLSVEPRVAKLDRSLVAGLGSSDGEGEAVVVATLAEMCAQLGIELIAEGTETAEQIQALQAFGITNFQGFHFATPQPALEFEAGWVGGSIVPSTFEI